MFVSPFAPIQQVKSDYLLKIKQLNFLTADPTDDDDDDDDAADPNFTVLIIAAAAAAAVGIISS